MQTQVDVVIPYHEADKHVVLNAATSIIMQVGVSPIIHMVADDCEQVFLDAFTTPIPPTTSLSPNYTQAIGSSLIYHYATPTTLGPYNIVNSLVPLFSTPYIAIQDADDISFITRLAKQLEHLRTHVMTSGAMRQEAIEGYCGQRHLVEPVIYPGVKFPLAPSGRCINSNRTMLKSFFIDQNGFASMLCSGDFQFDCRTAMQIPALPIYHSQEIMGIRYLRPNSLSNSKATGNGSDIRNECAWKVLDTVHQMRTDPTKERSRLLGNLSSLGK